MTVMRPWSLELNPWPLWDQLRDPMPAGLPEDNAANDCGPESAAMALCHLTGVALPADYIKDAVRGYDYTGYLDITDLRTFFEGSTQTPCAIRIATSRSRLIWTEWRALMRGHPIIGLFSFSAPGANDGHFRPVIRLTPTSVTTADPWTGTERVESHALHFAWSKGVLLDILRHRDRQLPG